MRLADWPRMPYLNEEVREWIAIELKNLGVEDLAVYALEGGAEGDERRVLVATEIGIMDHRYAPYGSSARFRLMGRLYPWQTIRGVDLRSDFFRLWAREHRARWHLRIVYPPFEAATEYPELGQALCDLARVCAVMAEPFGVPAGREGQPAPAPAGGGATAGRQPQGASGSASAPQPGGGEGSRAAQPVSALVGAGAGEVGRRPRAGASGSDDETGADGAEEHVGEIVAEETASGETPESASEKA